VSLRQHVHALNAGAPAPSSRAPGTRRHASAGGAGGAGRWGRAAGAVRGLHAAARRASLARGRTLRSPMVAGPVF
jgi:hypothetical protein